MDFHIDEMSECVDNGWPSGIAKDPKVPRDPNTLNHHHIRIYTYRCTLLSNSDGSDEAGLENLLYPH